MGCRHGGWGGGAPPPPPPAAAVRREAEQPGTPAYECVMLPVASIRLPDIPGIAVRTMEPDELQPILEAIARNGEIGHPLTVRPAGPGAYELVDGQVRLAGAIHRGHDRVPCRIRELTDLEALLVSLALDVTRRKPPADLDRAWGIMDTLRLLGLRAVEFANVSAYTESDISDARRLAEVFPREAVAAAAERLGMPLEAIGRTPRDTLRHLARIEDADLRIEAVCTHAGKKRRRTSAAKSAHVRVLADGVVRVDTLALRALTLRQRLALLAQLTRLLLARPG
jgi:ParB-like chromosome segregation protein Spo0J